MNILQTPAGKIQTHYDIDPLTGEKILRATGIPYARAQRFEPPHRVDLAKFGEPFDARHPAPAAPQKLRGKQGDIRQSVIMSEDCQNLSITAPADRATHEELPVMVYFHGGSYVAGSGDGARYNGQRLVIDERIILVNVTYRLGTLGFAGGAEGYPANLGLLDAREALRWVKENIGSFGGNPENITIFGQSAGGDLATQLLLAEGVLEERLVRRVISQSAPLNLVHYKDKTPEYILQKMAKIPRDAPAELYGELSWKMVSLNPLRFGFYSSMMPFGTQYGHYPLPDHDDVQQRWTTIAPHIQVLVGNNEREAAYFIPPVIGNKFSSRQSLLEKAIGRTSFNLYQKPAQDFIKRHRAAGGTGNGYILRVGNPLHRLFSAHCTELALLFDSPAWEGSALLAGSYAYEREKQGKALRTLWAGFARDGQINHALRADAKITLY